jgi:hypothetical protein
VSRSFGSTHLPEETPIVVQSVEVIWIFLEKYLKHLLGDLAKQGSGGENVSTTALLTLKLLAV